MEKLIQLVDDLLERLETANPARESLEWYLQNNLSDYKSSILAAESATEIENATLALSRFCTESMNWDEPLFKSCMEITEMGRKTAKK